MCIYRQRKKTVVLVYVDDLLIATKDKLKEKFIIDILSKDVKMKNLGQPSQILFGYRDQPNKGEHTYLSTEIHHRDIGTSTTSLRKRKIQRRRDLKLLGAFIYLAIITRPDTVTALVL